MVADLSDGDIELFLKTCHQRFEDASLILERLAPRNIYLQFADADIHKSLICRPGAIRWWNAPAGDWREFAILY